MQCSRQEAVPRVERLHLQRGHFWFRGSYSWWHLERVEAKHPSLFA